MSERLPLPHEDAAPPTGAASPAAPGLAGDAEVAAGLAVSPRTRRLAERLLGQDAGDGLQEVYREAERALPRFRGDSALQTWFFRLAIRTLCAFRRRRDRHLERFAPDDAIDSRLDEAVVRSFAATPLDRLAAEERRHRVLAALQRLSPALREVVLLRHEGLDYRAIAAAVDVPLGTVKSRLAAAMTRLATLLHEDDA